MRHAQLTSIIDSPDLLRLPIMIPKYPTTSPTPALVDSGATPNFLHEEIVDTLRIDTQPCPSIEVTVVDGRPLPTMIQRQVTLEFKEDEN